MTCRHWSKYITVIMSFFPQFIVSSSLWSLTVQQKIWQAVVSHSVSYFTFWRCLLNINILVVIVLQETLDVSSTTVVPTCWIPRSQLPVTNSLFSPSHIVPYAPLFEFRVRSLEEDEPHSQHSMFLPAFIYLPNYRWLSFIYVHPS